MTSLLLPLHHPTPLLSFHTKPLLLPSRTHSLKTRPKLFLVKLSSMDFETTEAMARQLFGRAEGFIYTIADSLVAASDVTTDATTAQVSKQNGDWFSGITNYMETVLKVLKDGLSALHVPYAYGFAIILLTVLVKAATFPLTKKQVESALAMKTLQPQVKAIQQRFAGDQERIQLETARLYKLAGINPLAGLLPTLATIPVWIGLYRALSNVADEGLLTEGFFWIPSLSGPTTIAARQSGSGTSWLFPFIDGHPPLGWPDTLAYLVLPVLLVVSQYISAQIMQPSQGTDHNQKNAQGVTKLLPLLIGYFALSVPSGLSLYWFTNNVLSTAQQIWLQKLGGADNPLRQFSDTVSRDERSSIQKPVSDIQKSVTEVETEKVNSSQGVKSDSDSIRSGERFKQLKEEEARITEKVNSSHGAKSDSDSVRPGERFKQLKEEEARRKMQREEEQLREKEGKKRTKEAVADSRITTEPNNREVKLVGNTEQDTENNLTKAQFPTINNGGLSCNAGPALNNKEDSHENVRKEMHASNDNHTSAHDALSRRDQEAERDEA